MTLKEVKENLCYYNEMNPSHNIDFEDADELRTTPREDCWCDNCCYSYSNKLAVYILELLKVEILPVLWKEWNQPYKNISDANHLVEKWLDKKVYIRTVDGDVKALG